MTAFEKEQIFVELRKYHLEKFPKSLSTPLMENLLIEFKELEDSIVGMLFGLVNGKTEYVDMGAQVKSISKKIMINPNSDKTEDSDRNLFINKLALLSQILNIAANSTFKLRPQRNTKIIRSINPRKAVED